MKLLTETQKPSKPGEYNIWFSNIRSVMPMFAYWDGEKFLLEPWMIREGKDLHFYEVSEDMQ